jgi:hypothetical protein
MDCFTFLKTARGNPLLRDIPILIFAEEDLEGEYRAQLARNSQAIFEKSQLSKQDFLSALSASVFAPTSS